jgi:tetratricopeptide (TPR) repeat protein
MEIAPQVADTHLALANYYWASGQMAAAEVALKRAVSIQSNHLGANRALATFYLATNRPAEAEQPFKAVAEISGTPESRLSLADYYMLTKRAQEALPILDDLTNDPRAFAAAKAASQPSSIRRAVSRRHTRAVDAALAKSPNDKIALIIKARMLLAENSWTRHCPWRRPSSPSTRASCRDTSRSAASSPPSTTASERRTRLPRCCA